MRNSAYRHLKIEHTFYNWECISSSTGRGLIFKDFVIATVELVVAQVGIALGDGDVSVAG